MIQAFVAKKLIDVALKKIMKAREIKNLRKYVEEDNELDKKVLDLDKRLFEVEKIAHPRRDFVVCNYCKNKMKQYEGTD